MPEPDEPLIEPLPPEAVALENKLHSLRSLDKAISEAVAGEHYDTAAQFARVAREHALAALTAALDCLTLPPEGRRRFSLEAIQHAERLIGVAPGSFSTFFAASLETGGEARRKELADLLVEVRDRVGSAPVEYLVRETPSWLPAVIRIGSAIFVGAAVGAPLAALAVGEPVVAEIVKAGIAVTACAVAAEVTNHLVERWLRPPEPAGPVAPRLVAGETDERGALPAPTEKSGTATEPLPELVDAAELLRRGRAFLETFEPATATPEKDPVRDPADLERAVPAVFEPPPPPPPRPPHLDDPPFRGFDL